MGRIKREFNIEGEPAFYLGTYRPWAVGFIDSKYSNKVWSDTMPLTLDSCYPIHHPESFTYRDRTHVGKYNFVTEPGFKIKMSGNYFVSTFLETTRSTVEVELKVELPYNVNWKTGFGVWWGL